MKMQKRAFKKKPLFYNLNKLNLHYRDALTYVAIKSFDNPRNGCFPSQETIAERSGQSKSFVIDSIERLEMAKQIRVYRFGYISKNRSAPNRYYFLDHKEFNPIPYDIFKTPDLTPNERAILLLLRQFAFSPCDIYGSLNEMAGKLGITRNVLDKQYQSLVDKGYLDRTHIKKGWTKLLKINWHYPDHIKHYKEKDVSSLIMT